MSHNLHSSLQSFKLASGSGKFYSLRRTGGRRHRQGFSPAGVDSHRAGSRCCATATARKSPKSTSGSSPTGRPTASGPTRSRSSSRASCCRTSPACRCWPIWRRCATSPATWARIPKIIEPLVPVDLVVDHSVQDRSLSAPGCARSQHEARVLAQQRALSVPEVGHAGVRYLQRGAAGHRHRAPGQSRIPGARRAPARTASTTPTRWSAPTATRR